MAGKLSQSGTRKGGANGIIAAEAVKNSKPDRLPTLSCRFRRMLAIRRSTTSCLTTRPPTLPPSPHVANLPFVLKAQIRGRALARMTSIVQCDDNAMLRHWA